MKKVIKHPKKMKNAMYIVFGAFALALFGITMLNPSYAEEGLIIDDALDAIAESTVISNPSLEDEELNVEENQSSEDEDITEPELNPDERLAEGDEIPQDLGDVNLEGDNDDKEEKEDENQGDKENEEISNEVENDENETINEEDKQTTEEIEEPKNEDNNTNQENHGVSGEINDNGTGKEENLDNNEQEIVKDNNRGDAGNLTGEFGFKVEGFINIAGTEGPSAYTILDQVADEWQNSEVFPNSFVYGEISIESPNDVNQGITIMDRNLGAITTGAYMDQPVASFGYYYQRGNNYGFDYFSTILPNSSKTPYKISLPEGVTEYSGSKFVYTSDGTWMATNRFTLRSGTNIQGPCPAGWHVPNDADWSNLLRYYYRVLYTGSARLYDYSPNNTYSQSGYPDFVEGFTKYFMIPLAGHRNGRDTNINWTGNYGYYTSSLPNKEVSIQPVNGQMFANTYASLSEGLSLRCFKDTYTPIIHTVKFNMRGGNGISDLQLLEGRTLARKLKTQPTRVGYSFSGRYLDSNLTIPYDVTEPIIQDLQLYAEWSPKIPVHFETNGGYDFETKYVVPGEVLELKNEPQKRGNFFEGWYTDEELTNPYDFSLPVSNSFTLYAKWNSDFGTISISDPDNPLSGFTIMDRNLGAKEVGTGENAYGYYYQRGNNHGFLSNGYNDTMATTLIDWKDEYNSGYYGTQFVLTYNSYNDYWSDNNLHNGLWGGSGDNQANNRGMDNISETMTGRQGPCPDGYHVPSAGELTKLMEYYNLNYMKETGLKLMPNRNYDNLFYFNGGREGFKDYFEMPFAGHYYQSNGPYYDKGNPTGYYRTSSPNYSSANSTFFIDDGYSLQTESRRMGESIRCFKNIYNKPEIYIASFNSNGGDEIEDIEIRENHKLIGLPTPQRENSIFNGWYLDEDLTNKYDFNNLIDGDLNLYAKWGCNSGYSLNEKLNQCEKISVNFRANGGNIGSEDVYKISSITKNLKGNEVKYSHTPNISDEGVQNGNFENSYSKNEVIRIEGVENLHIEIIFGGEAFSWVKMRTGSHSNYSASNTYLNDSVSGRLGGGNHNDPSNRREYVVQGDTVTFAFKSNYGDVGDGYGYYAVIMEADNFKTEYSGDAFDNIPEPTREGYTFKGWYFDSGTFQHEFDKSEVVTGESMDVYAKWYPNTYTVSFDADNDNTNPENMTVTYDSQYPELPVVNKTGYTFSGWYNGEEIVNSGDIVRITEDTTLIAKRTINQYKIIFDTDGGNEINPIEKDYNSAINITLPTPTKECNEFSGWDAELPERMPAHDITLKAIWEYTCSRSSGGGGGAKKSETDTKEIAIETSDEQHNSADDGQETKTPEVGNTPSNEETSNQVISVTQEILEDGTPVEVVIQTVTIKNTDIVATVRTEIPSSNTTHSSSSSKTHTKEEKDAYSFAKSNGITTTDSIDNAKMNTELTRIQMAKMLSNYAINVLGQEPDVSKGTIKFDDVTNKMDKQYDNAVTKAYQLGIMGQNMKNNEFRPNDEVTRAEFASALSRLLYQTEEGNYKSTGKYYIPHVAKLYNEGIINKTDPKIKEKRGYVMTMLMRTVQ